MRWLRAACYVAACLLLLACGGLAAFSNRPPAPQALTLSQTPARNAMLTLYASAPADAVGKPAQADALLNLNTATREQLMTLPGIGEKLAQAIMDAREAAPFYYVEDLRVVSGIGEKRLSQLRPYVRVE